MKTNSRGRGGFSLTELLVVIVIIVVLAGFTIGALPGIQVRINRAKVESFLKEIQTGLSRYEIDYGNYPLSPETGGVASDDLSYRDTNGQAGAAILYTWLSGDVDGDGDIDEDETVYVPRLGGKINANSQDKRVTDNPNGGGFIIIDSYNSPIRYLADPPRRIKNGKQIAKKTMNPDYDIWSIVDTNPARASDVNEQMKYVTNWTRN